MTNSKDKVFIGIIKNIQKIIINDQLKEGDKLPSERELSDRLRAGRSSVREALRSLELLGLIETKRGEGTYIKDPRQNNLIEILASFILTSEKAQRDLIETKMYIIIVAFQLACERINKEQLENLQNKLKLLHSNVTESEKALYAKDFIIILIESSRNYLLYRLWKELDDYSIAIEIHGEMYVHFLYKLYELLVRKDTKSGEQLIKEYYDSLSSVKKYR